MSIGIDFIPRPFRWAFAQSVYESATTMTGFALPRALPHHSLIRRDSSHHKTVNAFASPLFESVQDRG